MVFGAVVLAVFAIAGMVRPNQAAQRMGEAADDGVSVGDTVIHRGTASRALKAIEPFQRRLTQSDPDQVGEARLKLIQAGFYRRSAVDLFFTIRLVLAIGMAALMALGVFVLPTIPFGLGTTAMIFGGAAIGYYFPVLILRIIIDNRQTEFQRGLPDAMDLILVGVQAGLSLSASMRYVVRELGKAHPVVAEQFQAVMLEFEAGLGRTDALNRLAKRMQVPEARTFATMISQAENLGTSISDTLQVLADEMRISRMLVAEKKAAELPVRMAVPLVMLIFPCLMIVILTPVMISIMNAFAQM